jgi:hypothetical protein
VSNWYDPYVTVGADMAQGIAEDSIAYNLMSPTMANGVYKPVLTKVGLPTVGAAVTRLAPLAVKAYAPALLAYSAAQGGYALGRELGEAFVRPAVSDAIYNEPGYDPVRGSERIANPESRQVMNYKMNEVNARRRAKGLPTYNSKYGGSDVSKPSGALGVKVNSYAQGALDTFNPSRRNITLNM